MGGFLRFVTRGRYHAIGVSALSLFLPPFSFIGGAVIGLATLRYGAAEGLVVLVGSAAVFAVGMWALVGSIAPALVFVVVTGVPSLALCALLRATASQGFVLVAATLAAGAAIVVLYLSVPDPVEWWLDVFEAFLASRTGSVDPRGFEQLSELLRAVVTGLPIAVMVTSICIVFLARWAHAALDNPGGFGREFRDLRVGRRFAAVAGVVAILALFAAPPDVGVGHDLLMLIVAACAIQGIALVHGLVAQRRGARAWIVAMYASLLLVTPAAVLALSVAGFSDAWLDYRTRFNRSQ
ncbi:MAG: DUF2232 domain-containing protein [Gammaproteobacteria bacterium]|nr:DUF2232 domain-containing protein [Gammaproteobacteria bacterium]